MDESEFEEWFFQERSLKTQDVNFLKNDLLEVGAIYKLPAGMVCIALTKLGWNLAKAEATKRKKTERASVRALTNALAVNPPQRAIGKDDPANLLADIFRKKTPSRKQ